MSMTLATIEDLAAMEARILKAIKEEVKPAVEYLTIEQAAQLTGFTYKTVRKWITDGKTGMNGQKIYLPIHRFTDSEYRILLSELMAFGKAS